MLRSTPIIIFLLCLITTLPSLVDAADFRGKVAGVIDGDTIKVMRDGQEVIIHLAGIDCPEKEQPFGNEAKLFTSDRLNSDQLVTVKVKTTDKHGRVVADVILTNEVNLSLQILRAGFAWWDRKQAKYDRALEGMEAKAKASKKGLWADPDPMSPWEWRKIKRESQAKPKPPPPTITHSGDVKSRIFHRKGCRHYNCVACTITFKSKDEAIYSGYVPCELCKP